jgi:hypothetical protein
MKTNGFFRVGHGFHILAILALLVALAGGCGSDGSSSVSSGDNSSVPTSGGTINLTVTVENLYNPNQAALSRLLCLARKMILPPSLEAAEVSVDITPSQYKIALVNFWLIKDDASEVSILNPDITNPIYTETNPKIINFTATDITEELLSDTSLDSGTYVGYKMQFIYLEMQFPIVFHLPDIASESDLPSPLTKEDLVETQATYNFRLYFNAVGKYWKRDFVVELVDSSDEWFWMRRQLEDNSGYRNFFIAVDTNSHPSGGAGPDNTIDLFADEDFWGDEEDYSNSDDPIIISTESDSGGVNAVMQESFTISDDSYDLTLYVDVQNTLNFWEEDDASLWPTGITFTSNVLDLGPGFGEDVFGDCGLHPFVPDFRIEAESGD